MPLREHGPHSVKAVVLLMPGSSLRHGRSETEPALLAPKVVEVYAIEIRSGVLEAAVCAPPDHHWNVLTGFTRHQLLRPVTFYDKGICRIPYPLPWVLRVDASIRAGSNFRDTRLSGAPSVSKRPLFTVL
jgi:hypothetical protein